MPLCWTQRLPQAPQRKQAGPEASSSFWSLFTPCLHPPHHSAPELAPEYKEDSGKAPALKKLPVQSLAAGQVRRAHGGHLRKPRASFLCSQ